MVRDGEVVDKTSPVELPAEGFNLAAPWVIHTVGLVWRRGESGELRDALCNGVSHASKYPADFEWGPMLL